MRGWFYRNKWACARGCILCLSSSLSLSLSLYSGSFIQGIVYHQLVRPCGQTGESDRRHKVISGRQRVTKSGIPRKSNDWLGATYRSRYSADRAGITCARFVKIKDWKDRRSTSFNAASYEKYVTTRSFMPIKNAILLGVYVIKLQEYILEWRTSIYIYIFFSVDIYSVLYLFFRIKISAKHLIDSDYVDIAYGCFNISEENVTLDEFAWF